MWRIFPKTSSSKSKAKEAHKNHIPAESIDIHQQNVAVLPLESTLRYNYPEQREERITSNTAPPVYKIDPDRHGGRIIGFDYSSTGQAQSHQRASDQEKLLRDAVLRSQGQQESRHTVASQQATALPSKPETHKQHGGRIYDPGHIEGANPPRVSQQFHQIPGTQAPKRKVRYLSDW